MLFRSGQRALRSKQPLTFDYTDKTLKDANGNDLTFRVVGTQPSTVNTPVKIVFGSDQNETLTGGDVYIGDHLYGGGGADTLIGNGGNDYLEGGQGIDTYVYSSGDGQDTILDTDGLGKIVFNGVTLAGGVMFAGGYISLDKEFRYAFHGDLTTGGTLVINDDLRIENFRNGDLGITLGGRASLADIQPASRAYRGDLNEFYGSEGDDHFIAGKTAIFLGKGGDDLLEGNNWDYLIGGAGNDVITAGEYFEFGGNTGVLVLSGGAGSDIILGGEVAETIYGDMEQAVISPDGNSFHIDRFWFNSETAFGELFEGQYANAQYDNPFAAYSPDFADRTIYFFGGIDEALNYILGISESTDLSTLYDDFIDGGDGNDRIFGGFGSDTLFGGDGDDRIDGDGGLQGANFGIYANLFGSPGDDYLDGGAGNDTLSDGDGGNDTFIGGDGDDTIDSGDSLNGTIGYENYLEGGDGNDVLSSNNGSADGFDTLLGGDGNDALSSTYGNALLDGGAGNDIYAVSRDHVGHVTIRDNDGDPGTLDRLVFGTLNRVQSGEGEGGGAGGNLEANWNLVDGILPSEVSVTRDQSNLYLSVDGVQDTVTLLNWFVSDADRIEEVHFQDGTVWDAAALTAMATNADPVIGTPDDDALEGMDGVKNSLIGNAGDDTLAGGNADDVLNGGAGDDFLAGGAGNDTYVFNPGDGVDHVQDDAGANTLQFGAGIAPSMLTLGLGSLLIHVGSGVDAIHLDDFDPGDVFGIHTIDTFRFDDGTSLTYSQLVARGFDINGTDGNDLLIGTNVNDRFDGGPGNDTLIGGAGNDVYLFGLRSGQDQIEDYDATAGNSDTLRVGAAVTPDDLVISQINDDLLIKINGTQDQIAITNWFLGDSNMIERVQFSDGTTWDAATLESHIAGAPVNNPPVIANPINNQTANEDALFRFQIPANTFADVDAGDVLTFTATLDNGSALPSWLTFDAATRSLSGMPANGDVGTVQVRVTATDSGNASVSDTFDLTVINTNDAPALAHAIVPQAAAEDAAFSFTVPVDVFTDEDAGDTLSYLASRPDGSRLPAWLTFNAITRTFSGTPGNSDVGTVQVKVTATDRGHASVSDTFDLTVINTNDAPAIAHAIVPQAATEDAAFSFTVPVDVFADEDAGDTLSYLASRPDGSRLPAWLTFNAITRTFSGTPGNGDVGVLDVRLVATDAANASASTVFTVSVANVNDAPILNHAIVDQIATVGSAFALPLAANTFTDIDVEDTLTYGARLLDGSSLPAWLAFDAATCSFSGTPGSGDAGVYSIRVTASDSGNLSAFDIFDLTVAAAPGQDLVGTISNDVLTGGAGDDTLNGGGGSDRLVGNGGNDTFQYFGDATWSAGFVARNDGNPGNPGTGRIGAMSGMNRSFDVFQGGAGEDVLLGTSGDDALFLDDPNSPFPSGSEPRIAGIERIEMGDGDDVVDLISSYYAYVDVTLDGGDGNDVLWASSGDDVLLGGFGNDDLFGGAGRDYLSGGPGNDTINGDLGNDLLEGGDGNDALSDAFGNNLFYAGSGNDKAIGGSSNELFIGGKGNDTIVTGQGADIIAFNRGDGPDTIAGASATSSTTVDNTLSLGGGIRYQDLYLSQQGNSLVLDAGNQDRITLQNWYSSPASRGVLNLQMMAAAMDDFAPTGGDPLRDNRVECFNFQSIVRQFDQARIANPSVNRWAVMDALLDAHLGGSDTEALGGDLAYRYGLSGSLAGISTGAAQDVLADPQFGAAPQSLRPLASLTEGIVKLG